jgi:predicted transcriptional regulator
MSNDSVSMEVLNLSALAECASYNGRYRFRQASMRKLAEYGFVAHEPTDTRKSPAWRITQKGIKALSALENVNAKG